MFIIEDSQELKDYELIEAVCKILHITFLYQVGVDAISKNARKYFEKFFELSAINQFVKKQVIRIFVNVTNNMPDCFDRIEKAAGNYAKENNRKMYEQLLDCLDYDDSAMTLGFLKWVNQMVYKAEEEQKQAKFFARLETQGIFDKITQWADKGDEDILEQINTFTHESTRITPTQTYQLEVFKSRNKELELHSMMLERKLEKVLDQQAMFRVMMDDLEMYKQTADMSKEFATYFSPFTPINQFTKPEMSKFQTQKGMIDTDKRMRSKDQEKIKELEKQIIGFEEKMKEAAARKKEYTKVQEKFERERSEKEQLNKKIKDMQQEIDDQKALTKDVNDSLQKMTKQFLAHKMGQRFLKVNDKHKPKSQEDFNKNQEVFNLERRKLEKDLNDTKLIVSEQKNQIKKLKEERADLNVKLEELRN